MEMKESKKKNVLILTLSGELMGGEESQAFQNRIYRAIEEKTVQVVADVADIKWMNSSGLGIIMASLTTLRASGGDLYLCRVSERVFRPIQVTKLDQVIQLFDTVDKAVESFTSGG